MKYLKSWFMFALIAAVALVAFAVPAQAAVLAPETTLLKPGEGLPGAIYSAVQPAHYADAPVATLVSAYVGDFAGSVTSNVYAGPDGILGFEYVFTNTNPTPGLPAIVAATIGDISSPWLGLSIVDAGADASGASTAGGGLFTWADGDPMAIERDPTFAGEGVAVRWRALGAGTVLMGPDDVSAKIWLDVVALSVKVTDVGLLDSGAIGSAKALGPSMLPEPSTFVIWGLGLSCLGLVAWRRRSR